MTQDKRYIQRTFELARRGVGKVNPNPLVGAVIVKDDKVIGEGFHEYFGGPHAEVNAVSDAAEPVQGATLYVNLEPCSHSGKTPPCAQMIAEKGFSRVVIAMRDPNPQVAGRGIEILNDSGIEVTEGVLEEDAIDLNRVFVKYITTKQPYVVMKSAMTLDGKIATRVGDSRWVTGGPARRIVHELRNEYAAIMVGVNTVIADDPHLDTRLEREARNPVRIIADTSARTPMDAFVVNHPEKAKTIIAHTKKASPEKLKILREGGTETIETNAFEGKVDLQELMTQLGAQGIDSILLEGGGALNFSALKQGIVDEVFMFVAPKIVGGEHSKTPVSGKGVDVMDQAFNITDMKTLRVGDDIMIRGKVTY